MAIKLIEFAPEYAPILGRDIRVLRGASADPAETPAERRSRLVTAVEQVATSIGTAPACRTLGLARASVYRERRPAAVARPRPTRSLDRVERQEILDLWHTRFVC